MKKFLSLSLMLVMSICSAFADDVTITPVDPEDGGTVGYLYYIFVDIAGMPNGPYPGYGVEISLQDAEGNEVATGNAAYVYDYDKYAIQLNKAVIEPGTYTLSVGEGAFYGYDEDYADLSTPAFTATYTVTGEGLTNFTQSPAADEEAETISSFTMTFPDVESVSLKENIYHYFYKDDGEDTKYTMSAYTEGEDYVIDGNSVTFKLERPILTPGNYTLTFEPGDFLLGDLEEASSPITVNFTVTGSAPVEYSITPESGTYAKLQKFSIKFPTATALSIATDYVNITLEKQNYSGWDGTYYNDYEGESIEGTDTYNFQLESIVTDAGDYTLNIPAGTFYLDEAKTQFNTEINVNYTVDGTGGDKFVAYPENGSTVAKLDSVVITYTDETFVSLADADYASATLYKDGEYIFVIQNDIWSENPYNDFVEGPEANQQTIKFIHTQYAPDYSSSWNVYDVTEAGVYTFSIPSGTYVFGENMDRENTKISFTYTVDPSLDGISEVSADSKLTTDAPVYNVAGQRVNTNAKGLVIKNGKKYLNK